VILNLANPVGKDQLSRTLYVASIAAVSPSGGFSRFEGQSSVIAPGIAFRSSHHRLTGPLVSRPRGFRPEPLRRTVRKPLDLHGSHYPT
jgi:hypothetical protein